MILSWAAALLAAVWLRGDLVRPGLIWATLGFACLRLLFALRHMRHTLRANLETAKRVATTTGPLRRVLPSDPVDARSSRTDRLLRHELLAATELTLALNAANRDAANRDAANRDAANGDAGNERVRWAALGSELLAQRYVQDVEQRLSATDVDARWALPRTNLRHRVIALALVTLGGLVSVLASATLANGLGLWIAGVDATPPVPPEPVWSTMSLQLDYPAYTGRPRRVVPNPSGALRVPAGTEVTVRLTARRPAAAGRLLVNYDAAELSDAPPPELYSLTPVEPDPASADNDGDAAASQAVPGTAAAPVGKHRPGMRWQGTFVARGSGTWTLVLLDSDDDEPGDSSRRSPPLPLSQESDRPPEVELRPLPRERREVRERESVEIEFVARDDFGLARAQLVYQLPDGSAHRLPIDAPGRPRRSWRRSYQWDISQIPISERSEVLYWIEVRDNDPGLGLTPLPDPPGKRTRSATMRLLVRDDESEHAANIVKLRDIRDFAVDLLALRMLTRAYQSEPDALAAGRTYPPLAVRAAMARDLLARSGQLLALLSDAIDALSMDSLAQERDAATLTKVHQRLAAGHRAELELHTAMPPRSETERPDDAEAALSELGPHNLEGVTQLQDEVIRLDDLVHGQIIERLEALVARLEATQRKLVELLQQLKAGDQSVRSQIEQLEQRRREDLRRIAEARAMLSQEVDAEFMNLDAFETLKAMAREKEISQMLQRGEIDQALQQAQEQLGEIQGLRDQVQQKLGEAGPGPELSEEEQKRMRLLRELSRLQDDEGTLQGRTKGLHERWREAVSAESSSSEDREAASELKASLQEALEDVNDARLGRDGRRGLQDAVDELERLGDLASDEQAPALDLAESVQRVARALKRATDGSEASETEGKALRRAQKRADRLQRRLNRALPSPADALPAADQEQLAELEAQQRGLDKRVQSLLDDPLSDLLPQEGRQALRKTRRNMGSAAEKLDALRPGGAVPGEQRAWNTLQQAIESLRQGSPPPPSASSGDASTETERDLTLRDELMDAMREQPPEGYAKPVERYYEELLR
ncbi:MAG: hypothetical protein JKY37_21115 [Nannocystaceae bacterium]|nr:hypothetical protein [Nannocystaceae bacterium]